MALIPKRKILVTRVVELSRVNLASANVLDFSNATIVNFPPQATDIRLKSIFGHHFANNNATGVAITGEGYRFALRTPNYQFDAIDPLFYVPAVMKVPISENQVFTDIYFPTRNIIQFELSNYSGVAIDAYCWVTMQFEYTI